MAKCRVCGALLDKRHGRCKLGKICCECADNGFGCFTDPLWRQSMDCLIEDSVEKIAAGDAHILAYFGIRDVGSFRKRWTAIVTETPFVRKE